MNQFIKYVGLDTHKDTIADAAGGKPRFYGEIVNTPTALSTLLKVVSPNGKSIPIAMQRGRGGYGTYRQISDSGHNGSVVAPSLIPTRPGDRVKTHRRDSENLARLHRAGELTPVWISPQSPDRNLCLVRKICGRLLVQVAPQVRDIRRFQPHDTS